MRIPAPWERQPPPPTISLFNAGESVAGVAAASKISSEMGDFQLDRQIRSGEGFDKAERLFLHWTGMNGHSWKHIFAAGCGWVLVALGGEL